MVLVKLFAKMIWILKATVVHVLLVVVEVVLVLISSNKSKAEVSNYFSACFSAPTSFPPSPHIST